MASDAVLNNDDDFSDGDDDEFGMENAGMCCFMNSLPIIYFYLC
jgi:ubiquitin C-terminal hydrolase